MLLLHPATVDVVQHAHGLDDFGVAQRAVGILLGRDRRAVGLGQRRVGAAFIEPRQAYLHQRPRHRGPAQHRAGEKQDEHEHQRDRGLHERAQHRVMEKVAHGTEVVHGLYARRPHAPQIGLVHGLKDARRHALIEQLPGLAHGLGARPVEHLHDDVSDDENHRQHDEGGVAAAVHHALIDLEHVGGGCQYEQRTDEGETEGAPVVRLEGQDGFMQLGRFLVGVHAVSSTIRYAGISSAPWGGAAAVRSSASANQNASSKPPSSWRDSTISRRRWT